MFVQETHTNKENTKQLIRQTGKFKTKKQAYEIERPWMLKVEQNTHLTETLHKRWFTYRTSENRKTKWDKVM